MLVYLTMHAMQCTDGWSGQGWRRGLAGLPVRNNRVRRDGKVLILQHWVLLLLASAYYNCVVFIFVLFRRMSPCHARREKRTRDSCPWVTELCCREGLVR